MTVNIRWKMQHVNMSCACAGVAMLLSAYGIDKEDCDVIEECRMPFLIEYDQEGDFLQAGMLVQRDEVFNLLCRQFDLEIVSRRAADWQEYFPGAVSLLENGRAFMTSATKKLIPLHSYDKIRNDKNAAEGHAIVLYKYADRQFHFYDPSGGLDKQKEFKFEDVEHLVSAKISEADLRKALEEKNGVRFIIGFLQRSSGAKVLDLDVALENSLRAVQVFRDKMLHLEDVMMEKYGAINYDGFLECIFAYIKPMALDLKNAVKVMRVRTDIQGRLVEKLDILQNMVLQRQRGLKGGSDEKSFSPILSDISQTITELTLKHLDSFRTLYQA
ncbi:MAG: hypothetical protein QME74_02275 [Candidatus Edwardsbacteria bacterium]|nr:hypothetical protein [Candidatus Edwardsbacteria bacterium]